MTFLAKNVHKNNLKLTSTWLENAPNNPFEGNPVPSGRFGAFLSLRSELLFIFG